MGANDSVAIAKKLSFKERSELEKIPGLIEQYESVQRSTHAKMLEPDYFKQSQTKIAQDQTRLCELDNMLVAAYARWDELVARES